MYDGILNLNRTVNTYTLDHTLKQYPKYALVKSHTTANPSHKQLVYCVKKSNLINDEQKLLFGFAVTVKDNKQHFYPKLIELVQTQSNYYLVCEQANMFTDAALSQLYRHPAEQQAKNRMMQELRYLCESVPVQLTVGDFVVVGDRVAVLPYFGKPQGSYTDNNRKVYVEALFMLCFGETTKDANVEKLRDFYCVVTDNYKRADFVALVNQHVSEVEKTQFGSKGGSSNGGSQTGIKYPMDMKIDIPEQPQQRPQPYQAPQQPQPYLPVQQVSSLPNQQPQRQVDIRTATSRIPVLVPHELTPNLYQNSNLRPPEQDIEDQINNIGVNTKMKQLASHIRNTRLSQIQAEDNEAPGLDELGIQMEPTPQRQGPVPTYQPQNAYNPYDMRNQQNHMNTAKIVSPGPQQQPYQQKQNITQPVVNPQQNFVQQKQQNATQPYPAQNTQQKPVQDAKYTQQQPQNQNQKPYQQPQQPQQQPQPQQKPQQPQPQQPQQQKPHPQPQPQPKPNPKTNPQPPKQQHPTPPPQPPPVQPVLNNPFQNKKNPNLNTVYVKKDPKKDETDFIFSTINTSFMGPSKKNDTFKNFSSKALNQTKMLNMLPSKKQQFQSLLTSYMSQFDLFHEMSKSFLTYYTGTNMGIVAAYLVARCSRIRKMKLVDALLRQDELFDLGTDLYKYIDKMKYVNKIQQTYSKDDPQKLKAAINFKMILPQTLAIMQPYLGEIDVDDRTEQMTFYYLYCLSKKSPSNDRHNMLLHDCMYVLLHTNQQYVYDYKSMPKHWDEAYVNDKKKTIELLMFKIQ